MNVAVKQIAPAGLRILVGIATAGRRGVLHETLAELARQTRLPDKVIVCPANPEDVDREMLSALPFPLEVVAGRIGLPSQRNAILSRAERYDALIFFDDDFFPTETYLAHAEALLLDQPGVVIGTGKLLEDGIHGPGLTADYARAKLAASAPPPPIGALVPYYGAYGCNMVVRLAPVLQNKITFDEMLPLYAWQEDVDFSRQLVPFGTVVRSDALSGIHLGVKGARTSGLRVGYSQIANPIYLMRKGTMSLRFGGRTMFKNIVANIARLRRPEPHIDRMGRCKGNIRALYDLIRGRLHPQRILDFE